MLMDMRAAGWKRGVLSLKFLGAATVLLISAWFLLGYEGLRTTAEDRARGWDIYELPSHPIVHMVVYLALGLALPFLAAWLMCPSETWSDAGKTAPPTHWRSYLFRLGFSFAVVFATTYILAFLEMALLDAGVI